MPVPDAPETMVIQGTELVVVQLHVPLLVTCTVRNADADVSDTLVVESPTPHAGAACVTVNTLPPIVSVPVLGWFEVLAAVE
jgi:hypothetical protein